MSVAVVTSTQRCAWWACGVDAAVLESRHCPHVERVRFGSLGSLVILAAAVSFIAASIGTDFMFFDGRAQNSVAMGMVRLVVCIGIGLLWSSFVLNLLRLTVGLAGRRTDRLTFKLGDIVRALGIMVVTAALSLPSATPLQVVVTERDASARALAMSQVEQINESRLVDRRRVDRLAEKAGDASDRLSGIEPRATERGFFARVSLALDTNLGFCATVFLGIWLLFALPPAIRLLTDRGAYDFLIEHRNRQWLAASGIEPSAYTIFSADGTAIREDAFHLARAAYRKREAEILAARRYDSELQRQEAAARLATIRSGRASVVVSLRPVRARKKKVDVSVVFATDRCEVPTREGSVIAEVGDAIVTAKTGETWPVPRASFELRYVASPSVVFGEPGTYYTRQNEVRAARLIAEASIEVARGRSELDAKPGDWLIDYGDGSNGVIAPEIFERTYEILDRQESDL